ncbi:MAG: PAS domain S-box protein, partial [Verrucomicrobia bacterium]|nr:PAS domain S-box protein [Verrucomicrobiota bacterium]
MQINSLVRHDYHTVEPNQGVASCEEKLRIHGFLIVMDGATFKGILTSDDIVRTGHTLVIDCLRPKPSVQPSATIQTVRQLMKDNGVNVLPVFQDAKFQGVITSDDILAAILDYQGELQKEVTERKKAEETLLESERRYRTIIQTAMDGFWLVDAATGRLVDVNASASSMLGYTREEFLARGLADIDAQWSPEELGREMQKVKTAGKAFFETRHRTKGGQIIDVEISVNYLATTDQFVSFIRDITERKAMQAKLLASEKLAVMGRLIADVAHEINNPLAIIAGSTYVLEEMVNEQAATISDSEDKAKMLEKIKKATNRCKHIVAALFVSTSPTMLGIKPAQINEVINESLESLDDQIKRQNVKVVKALAPRLPIIKADGHRLMQVFVNMFRNACDAMPEGGKLMIATRLYTPKADAHGEAVGTGAAIEIEISDTGVGILKKDFSKIFDPFVTTKKDGKGVGLGLSVSYGIIREHGGSISVASERGKGATFTIKVPVTPPPPPPPPP